MARHLQPAGGPLPAAHAGPLSGEHAPIATARYRRFGVYPRHGHGWQRLRLAMAPAVRLAGGAFSWAVGPPALATWGRAWAVGESEILLFFF